MKAFQINDNKGFMKVLLSGDSFDEWILSEATVIKGASLILEGIPTGDSPTKYKSLKNIIFEFIRGKETPSYMKFVLLFPEAAEGVLSRSLNVLFRDGMITVTTGVALEGFSLDRSIENDWDVKVTAFLEGLGIDIQL